MRDVPQDLKPVVSALVGGKQTVDQFEVYRSLSSVVSTCMKEDRAIFGKGLFGLQELGGGDNVISEKEQARAMRKNALVKPVLDYIYETRGE